MELSEECVEVNDSSGVDHELVPVGTIGHHLVLGLELRDYLLEIPGEGKNVTMLLLAEYNIGSNSLVVGFDTCFFLFLLWSLNSVGTKHSLRNIDSSGRS